MDEAASEEIRPTEGNVFSKNWNWKNEEPFIIQVSFEYLRYKLKDDNVIYDELERDLWDFPSIKFRPVNFFSFFTAKTPSSVRNFKVENRNRTCSEY